MLVSTYMVCMCMIRRWNMPLDYLDAPACYSNLSLAYTHHHQGLPAAGNRSAGCWVQPYRIPTPTHTPNPNQAFLRLQQANYILSNPVRRRDYDRQGW